MAAASDDGGPDLIIIPEVPLDEAAKSRLLERTERVFRASRNAVFAISEGTRWADEEGNIVQAKTVEFGPRKLGGVADKIVKYIEKELQESFDESNPLEVRPHHCDYAPRAGAPCEYDLRLVEVLAKKLSELLERRRYGKVPVLRTVVPYDELTVAHTAELDIEEMEPLLFPYRDFYDEERLLTNGRFSRFLRTITSGPDVAS